MFQDNTRGRMAKLPGLRGAWSDHRFSVVCNFGPATADQKRPRTAHEYLMRMPTAEQHVDQTEEGYRDTSDAVHPEHGVIAEFVA